MRNGDCLSSNYCIRFTHHQKSVLLLATLEETTSYSEIEMLDIMISLGERTYGNPLAYCENKDE